MKRRMSAYGPNRTLRRRRAMSASLIGRLGSSTFRLFTAAVSIVAHRLVLLFGIGAKALPSWDSKTRRNNLLGGLTVSVTAGPSRLTNSPHPSSREGHHSTAGWSSSFLLSDVILYGLHAAAGACSRVQRNSVPSTQGHDRLFNPAAPGNLHRPGLEPAPFLRTQHALSCFVEHDPHHLISAA